MQDEQDDPDCTITIHRIEVNFAIPVNMTESQQRALHDVISEITKATVPPGCVHWVSGYGQKPMWSQDDQRFLGQHVDPSASQSGEPTWDETTFQIETCCRERHPNKPV